MSAINIVLAQLNFTVGDLDGNAQKIITAATRAQEEYAAEIILFPELALCGYPPEDLLLRSDFLDDCAKTLEHVCQTLPASLLTIIGYPEKCETQVFNSAAVIFNGQIIAQHRKQCLPNYGVFDEERYFNHGTTACVFTYKDVRMGLIICEDLWHREPAQQAQNAGAQLLFAINASPSYQGKLEKRLKHMRKRVAENQLPLLYVNHCCGQDDLIFDGSSFVMNDQGKITAQAPFAEEVLLPVVFNSDTHTFSSEINIAAPSATAQMYQSLVMGVRDYIKKNHFTKVIVGFSGGIDSALTLVIATDALGKENVLPIVLPSRHTSNLSIDAANEQLMLMRLQAQTISIEPSYATFLADFKEELSDLTKQNIQARCRGIILMALSNQTGALLLNTSNKSEMAVGYGTLYGDMCGGYAVLKDVWKTAVYQLAQYRNQLGKVIPQSIIDRPPTAELSPNQLDVDTLPPYDILDPILQRYIEEDQSIAEIIAAGFDTSVVKHVIKLVKINEYKRRQHAPGPRVTKRAFTRDRRYPITSGYKG